MGFIMKERQRIIAETSTRYCAASKKEKGHILNELTALTGYSRKYALHLLSWWGKTAQRVIDGTRLKIVIGLPGYARNAPARKSILTHFISRSNMYPAFPQFHTYDGTATPKAE
jgi:hypothetical protein